MIVFKQSNASECEDNVTKEISVDQTFIDQEIFCSVLNLLKLCDYSLAFEYQVVYMTVLVRNQCYDANIDVYGIFIVFYQKAQGENASRLSVL